MTDTFRKEFSSLTGEQKEQVEAIKDAAENLLSLYNTFVPADERSERSRCVNIGRTNLEQSVMWAVKGVTTNQE